MFTLFLVLRILADDNNAEAMIEAERIMRRSLPKDRLSTAEDDDYARLRCDSTSNGARSRPLSDTNVFLPIRLDAMLLFL